MSVYLQDGLVLLDGGSVAIDTGCCCGGIPTCDCNDEAMYPPFFNPIDGLFYAQRIDDCCAMTTTYIGGVPEFWRFKFKNSAESSCGCFSGSVSAQWFINEFCLNELNTCSGEIDDCDHNCIEGDASGCTNPCGHEGCYSGGTINSVTLTEPCVNLGQCCSCLGCQTDRTHQQCNDVGGTWYQNGPPCDDICPTGRCCSYDPMHNIFCAFTTMDQCNAACCDPPCPGWTFVWYGGSFPDCLGCPPL